MTKREELLDRISVMSDDAIAELLKLVPENRTEISVSTCPHCTSKRIIRFGHRCGKQRFRCKDCGKTFVTTTNTIMYYSHFPAGSWKNVIEDTLRGCSIDHTARELSTSHQSAFELRQKVLLALLELLETSGVELSGVVELDETFVLDSYKGTKLDSSVGRSARKHGAVAQKPGISNEYVCINTGVERQGGVYAVAVNRAKPSAEEIKDVYAGHIAGGSLVLCDGLKSYHGLSQVTDCTLRDCTQVPESDKNFFHLNTVNSLHSFVKGRYRFYRGVATKYLNRYNALFSVTFRAVESSILKLMRVFFTADCVDRFHSGKTVKSSALLVL